MKLTSFKLAQVFLWASSQMLRFKSHNSQFVFQRIFSTPVLNPITTLNKLYYQAKTMNLRALMVTLMIFSITAKKQLILVSDTSLTVKILKDRILPLTTTKTEQASSSFGSNLNIPMTLPSQSILPEETLNVKYADPDLELLRKLSMKEQPMPQFFSEKEKDKVVDNGKIDNGYTPILLSPESTEADKQLSKNRWVFSDKSQPVSLTSKCFYNACPDGEYTFYISSPCSYTVYLIGSNGLKTLTIGTGVAFTSNSFKCNVTACGRHSIRIQSFCEQENSTYYRFSLYQDRTTCYNCPDIYRHSYNPGSCKCECAVKHICPRPLKWFDYPVCGCSCAYGINCLQEGQFFDKKTCTCKCIPKCCPLFKVWNYDKCICEEPTEKINNLLSNRTNTD